MLTLKSTELTYLEENDIQYRISTDYEVDYSTLKDQSLWDVERSVTYVFYDSLEIRVISTAVPLISDPNTMTVIVEIEGDTRAWVFDYSFDVPNETMVYYENDVLTPYQMKAWNDWIPCMKGFFASEIGTVVQVASVASAVGCAACGAVAAFYTGVAALGCLG